MAITTITTTTAEDTRLVAAFGSYLNLGRNATAAEIKGAIAVFLKSVVYQYEVQQATNTAVSSTTQIAPT